jgi:hypothetical protein
VLTPIATINPLKHLSLRTARGVARKDFGRDLDMNGVAVYLARMGNAISPRGDMLKHRVLTRSKRGTHDVVDKLNLN